MSTDTSVERHKLTLEKQLHGANGSHQPATGEWAGADSKTSSAILTVGGSVAIRRIGRIAQPQPRPVGENLAVLVSNQALFNIADLLDIP